MKKLLSILLVVFMIAAFAVGCGSGDDGNGDVTYEDGVYFAQDEVGTSWTYFVVVTVTDGMISDAYWGGTNLVPQGDKYELDMQGLYGMAGSAPWYKQADAAVAWLIENQDPALFDDNYTDDAGHTEALETDDGTMVSIHVIEFFELAKEALASDPVAEGSYMIDGYVANAVLPTADGDEWEYGLDLIVVNGTIVSSNYNALYIGEFSDDTAGYFVDGVEGSPSNKKLLGMDYGMDWAGNAEKIDAYVVENQAFDVNYTDDSGHTDSITGVSIHVMEYETLFNDALGM